MSYRRHAPNNNNAINAEPNEPFGFLKTVVSGDSGLQRNETDSDKENDQSQLMTITEESTREASKNVSDNRREHSQGHSQGQAVDGKVMAENKEKDMWDDFYNEEEFKMKNDEPRLTSSIDMKDFSIKFDGEDNSNSSNRVLEKVDEENEVTDDRSQGDDYSSIFESSVKDDDNDVRDVGNKEDDKDDNSSGINSQQKKKGRSKKLFKRRLPSQSSTPSIVATSKNTGGSHPDLGRPETNNHSNYSNHLETMSESGGAGNKGRRLSRRKQVSRPRCAGPSPGGDVLQQKYQELEQLCLKPLPNPAVYVKQTKQQMMRLHGLGNQYHASNHNHAASNGHVPEGLPPQPRNNRDEPKRHNQVIIEEVSDQGYSTIRTIQVVQGSTNSSSSTRNNRPQTAHPTRRPRPLSGNRQLRPASAGRGRPASATHHRPQENGDSANEASHGSRGRGVHRKGQRKKGGSSKDGNGSHRSDSESKDHSSRDSRDSRNMSSDNQSRSKSRSPIRTDSHMKYSNNPALQEWLKTKNKQHRQQKREERKKKREERAEKQDLERQRQESFKDSDKRVKDWMVKKKKEAWKKAKEEKKRAQEEEMEREERQERSEYNGSLMGRSIKRPQSAPAHSERKMFIPISRPDGDQANSNNNNDQEQVNGDMPVPQPPKSKFVYKRPVSGRVRLMKLQQERKEDTKKQDRRKKEMEQLTEDEKNRKMRMSYDQWLVKKRQEDYERRQNAARQRALAKSDPELERIVPEMAKKRIENLQRGKRHIHSSEGSIDQEINKSFGGGDFGKGEVGHVTASQEVPGLQVSGQRKSMGQRPSSAKPPSSNGPLNPQMSKSPRRPKSAHPRIQNSIDASAEEGRVVEAKEFKLPFSPELGVPKYVAQRQEKLFSASMIAGASTDKDWESQKPPVEVQENGPAEPLEEAVSEQVKAEKEEFEPEVDGVEAEESSFFVTEGGMDDEDKQALEEEAFDGEGKHGEEDDQAQSESIGAEYDEDKEDQPEKDDVSDENKMDGEDEEEKECVETKTGDDNKDEEKDSLNGQVEEEPDNEMEKTPEDKVLEDSGEYSTETVEVKADVALEMGNSMEEELSYEELKLQLDTDESDTLATADVKEEEAEPRSAKEGQNEEEDPKSEVSESKSSTKHVSFVKEAIIHEDPLVGIPQAEYDTTTEEDEAEDERGGDFFDESSPRDDEEFWEGNKVVEQIDQGDDEDYF